MIMEHMACEHVEIGNLISAKGGDNACHPMAAWSSIGCCGCTHADSRNLTHRSGLNNRARDGSPGSLYSAQNIRTPRSPSLLRRYAEAPRERQQRVYQDPVPVLQKPTATGCPMSRANLTAFAMMMTTSSRSYRPPTGQPGRQRRKRFQGEIASPCPCTS
jgi:hypothetical protein